jgi:hypothetical protein
MPQQKRRIQPERGDEGDDVGGMILIPVSPRRRAGPAVPARVRHDHVEIAFQAAGHGVPAGAVRRQPVQQQQRWLGFSGAQSRGPRGVAALEPAPVDGLAAPIVNVDAARGADFGGPVGHGARSE